MSEPFPEDPATEPNLPDCLDSLPPEVSFVVPAPVFDSIATDDELASRIDRDVYSPNHGTDLGPALQKIDELGRTLGARIEALAVLFDREIRAEATREKVVDRLHAELQEYKQDLLLSAMRPVFIDLIQLHDDVGKMAESLRSEDGVPFDAARAASHMKGIQQGIEDILYRQGIEPFQHESESFDARRQRAVATVATSDPDQARRVAERLRKGFVAGEKVIRPEVVSVFVHRASTQ